MVFVPETLEERFARVSKAQKSTWVVRPDDFRADDRGVYSHAGDMGLIAWSMAMRVFEEILPLASEVRATVGVPGSGKTTWIDRQGIAGVLYFDSTLSKRKNRRTICDVAAAAGRPIDCVVFHTELDVCLARNQERSPDRRVPETSLRRAHRRLVECPPGMDEGWRTIIQLGPTVDELLDRARRDL